MSENLFRPYQPDDRQAVFKIAADTAFFGEPVEAFLDDRRLFNDIFMRYYTDLEPEHGWVAIVENEVVGYLMGSADTRKQRKKWLRFVLPDVINKIFRRDYRIGILTLRYLVRLVEVGLHNEHTSINMDAYPAHLHINFDSAYRGRGLGKGLMKIYIEQLRQENVKGVHLVTTNLNVQACRLYEGLGFNLLDARFTHLWQDVIKDRVENRCYGLRLN